MADAAVIVPLMVSAPKPFAASRIRTVRAAPFIVTVLDVPANAEPAPEVSQFPATVHEPEVVMTPEAPPVMVTFPTFTVEVPAVRVAPLLTVRFPPVPVSPRLAVDRVAALLRVRVAAHRRPFVAMVNVAPAVGLNCTLLNSATPRLPKVMTREMAELKTIVPVPADQDPLVDEFVHEPLKVQVAAPKEKNPAAAMLTLPLIVLAPPAPPEIPPAILAARTATVNAKVLLARTAPAFTVRVPDTSTRPVCVTVPAAEIVKLLKLFAAFKIARLLAPLIVTVLVPLVNTEPAPLVSQFPESVRAAVVSVIVPLVPPVIATLDTAIADAFAVRMPPSPTFKAPPVSPRFAVARVVVEVPSETVNVPAHRSSWVAIVKVCPVPAEEVKATLLNSLPERLVPANVIVPPVGLVNVTVPVPGTHPAEVDAFVQVPATDQTEPPRLIALVAVRTLTLPETLTVEFRAMNVP
jgi:hypothetical protein